MEQLLLVTSCDSPAGIGASLRTHERTDERTDGWTDKRDVGNNILDYLQSPIQFRMFCKMRCFEIFSFHIKYDDYSDIIS